MVKLVNFDAENPSSSLEGAQPRPRVGVRPGTFSSLAQSFFTFQIQLFHKTLLGTITNHSNLQSNF